VSLLVENLRVQYGGRVAVADLQLAAPAGAITGLVGPNGAGKTSALGAIGGQVAAAAGTISLDGVTLSGLPPWKRAMHGLGRSFQRASVFPGLAVRQDVGLGWEAARVGRSAPRLFVAGRHNARRTAAVDEALALVGVVDLADRMTETLSLGDRRRVELARCMAGERRMLLLDEPSCNLDAAERSVLGDALLAVVAARRIGILIVDHDLELIARVCDRAVVLDQGQMIFEGDPAGLGTDAMVRTAFIGGALR
jgi:ABC-type branched-subunit amino acid transport system ATPase component